MARKAKTDKNNSNINTNKAHIIGSGEIIEQKVTDTLEVNYMPYAMSVIMSRAIPEIDGFKPSHRKILYTMYKMGLLTGPRAKSAKIVGQVMMLNPHGDGAIYETMVRLSAGYNVLLHPYIDTKGNFGKAYSKDLVYAASRYTEAKLDKICAELFNDIDKDTVNMVENFDNTMKEPTLLPVTFPSILVNYNNGIAVGMASNICSFNLTEICNATIELIKNPKADITDIVLAPDFSGGGILLYNEEAIKNIYSTGRGSFKIRSKYRFDKSNSCIEVYEIPPTTTSEAIIDKIIEKVKDGKFKEINDIRDETDRGGLKIAIDVKKGTDVEKLMKKLYANTPLEDSFACNFNVLVGLEDKHPKVLGVNDLILEWIDFRTECVRRRTNFILQRNKDKLHLLRGMEKILLDIDKAIKIIRETEEESEVVPNLMIGFKIDKIQAEYVAEIKLRHLNKEYILKRLKDIDSLMAAIVDEEDILAKPKRIKQIIITELKKVIENYGVPRKTEIAYTYDEAIDDDKEDIPDYPVTLFFTKEGYFKKVTTLSLTQSARMNGTHKLKEKDEVIQSVETTNNKDLLFFTNMYQCYKSNASLFEDTKISNMGDYVAAKLGMDEGEVPVYMVVTDDSYKGYVMFFFDNGKGSKIELSAYKTITNRKKLINAYSDKSPLVKIVHLPEDKEIVLISSAGRHLLLNTAVINAKTTKNSAGVGIMQVKKGQRLINVRDYNNGEFAKAYRFRAKNLPALGALLSAEDSSEQLSLE